MIYLSHILTFNKNCRHTQTIYIYIQPISTRPPPRGEVKEDQEPWPLPSPEIRRHRKQISNFWPLCTIHGQPLDSWKPTLFILFPF